MAFGSSLNPEISRLHLLIVCQFGAGAMHDHLAAFQDVGAFHQGQRAAHILLDQQDRGAHLVISAAIGLTAAVYFPACLTASAFTLRSTSDAVGTVFGITPAFTNMPCIHSMRSVGTAMVGSISLSLSTWSAMNCARLSSGLACVSSCASLVASSGWASACL